MSERKADSWWRDLAGRATELRARFVQKDAVLAEVLGRPIHAAAAETVLPEAVGQRPRSAYLREGARLELASGLREAFGAGWHHPDGDWGCWSAAEHAELSLDLDPGVALPAVIRFDLACLIPSKGDQRLVLSSPARRLAEIRVDRNDDAVCLEAVVEPQDLSGRRLHLVFDIDGLVFEGSLPGSQDTRWLGIAVKAVQVGET